MSQIKLSLHQGDDKQWDVTITSDGSPTVVDLSGVQLAGDIRTEYESEVVGSFNFTETDLPNGQFSFSIDKVTSANLPVQGFRTSFVFDIQITYPGTPTTIETPITGYLVVQREVTR